MNTQPQNSDQSDLIRRVNNYLTLCMTHAEAALDSEQPAEMAEALRWILEGAQAMEPHARVAVQRELPFAAAAREAALPEVA